MPTSKKIDELYDLIDGIETAMFTTRRPNGQLVSRPMQTQDRIEGCDLWFVTDAETHKLDDLALDPHVNETPMHATLGEAYLALGRAADAARHLEIAATATPNDARLASLLQRARAARH